MSWSELVDVAGLVIIAVGAVMSLTTAIGLLRLADIFARQHAAAKPQMLGLLLTLLGVGLRLRSVPEWSMLLLVLFFQMLTVPVSAHLVTRAARRGFATAQSRSAAAPLDPGGEPHSPAPLLVRDHLGSPERIPEDEHRHGQHDVRPGPDQPAAPPDARRRRRPDHDAE